MTETNNPSPLTPIQIEAHKRIAESLIAIEKESKKAREAVELLTFALRGLHHNERKIKDTFTKDLGVVPDHAWRTKTESEKLIYIVRKNVELLLLPLPAQSGD